MRNSLCAICGGNLKNQKTTLDRMIDGHLYLFEKVSIQICEKCNEMWIPGREAERMDHAIQGKIKPHRRVSVPVY